MCARVLLWAPHDGSSAHAGAQTKATLAAAFPGDDVVRLKIVSESGKPCRGACEEARQHIQGAGGGRKLTNWTRKPPDSEQPKSKVRLWKRPTTIEPR